MATTKDYIEYVCERLHGAGGLRYRKMFGEYMVYVNDKPVLLVCDNTVFVKIVPELAALMADAERGLPYEGAKEHYILDIGRYRPSHGRSSRCWRRSRRCRSRKRRRPSSLPALRRCATIGRKIKGSARADTIARCCPGKSEEANHGIRSARRADGARRRYRGLLRPQIRLFQGGEQRQALFEPDPFGPDRRGRREGVGLPRPHRRGGRGQGREDPRQRVGVPRGLTGDGGAHPPRGRG